MYVRQDVSDKASYLKDILGNAIRRRLYENVTLMWYLNASLLTRSMNLYMAETGRLTLMSIASNYGRGFYPSPISWMATVRRYDLDNVIADIERMFNRDTRMR